jgi:pyruvate-formate lyase-activating enzyme
MHLTLHLTARCNLRCRYCYAAPHQGGDMTWDVARSAVDLAVQLCRRENPDQSTGIIFERSFLGFRPARLIWWTSEELRERHECPERTEVLCAA